MACHSLRCHKQQLSTRLTPRPIIICGFETGVGNHFHSDSIPPPLHYKTHHKHAKIYLTIQFHPITDSTPQNERTPPHTFPITTNLNGHSLNSTPNSLQFSSPPTIITFQPITFQTPTRSQLSPPMTHIPNTQSQSPTAKLDIKPNHIITSLCEEKLSHNGYTAQFSVFREN